jgi:hypothetical protein
MLINKRKIHQQKEPEQDPIIITYTKVLGFLFSFSALIKTGVSKSSVAHI